MAIALIIQSISPFDAAPYNEAAKAAADQSQNQQSYFAAIWKWTTHDPVAFYTSLLAVFTFVLALSTIGLWIVTYLTLRHAREDAARQSDEMQKSIAAAAKAAEAAQKQVKIAQENFDRLERPYIFIFDLQPPAMSRQRALQAAPVVRFEVANYGKTPATIWHVSCVAKVGENLTFELIADGFTGIAWDDDLYRRPVLPPNDIRTSEVPCNEIEFRLETLALDRIFGPQPAEQWMIAEPQIAEGITMFVVIMISYRGPFGGEYTTFSSWRYEPTLQSFIEHGGDEYNYVK